MFIEAGFNDFLAKPIDVSKLDEIIEKWLPREKQIKADGGPLSKAKDRDVSVRLEIPGIDVRRGIIMTGGSEALYRQVLSTFRHDAGERLPLLQTPPEEMDMHLFITQVHALKSASANIGAAEVSAEAARLETAGRNGDMAFIEDALPMFAIRIAKLIEIIEAALAAGADAKTSAEPAPDADYYPLLRELAAALEAENTRAIDRLLEDLNQRTLDAKTRESLEQISDRVLMAEFGAALEIIAGMTGGNDLRPSPIPTV
jgi:HPt (histidine-containing phosphotransfer) domain-containing protein